MIPVVLAPEVAQDLLRIFRHKAIWSTVDNGKDIIRGIQQECCRIGPNDGMPWKQVRRKRLKGGYLAFFHVRDSDLLVLGLFHERENWTATLPNRLETLDPA